MTFWIENFFICLAISIILAGIIIPNIMTIAFKRRLFDEVNDRKIHQGVVPRLGGISFLPAFIFSFCVVLGCNFRLQSAGISEILTQCILPIFFLQCALMLMYLVGIADDLVGVRYRAKFLFQIFAAVLIIISGSWLDNLYGFCGIEQWPSIFGWFATILLVLYVVNAINLIDGIDGLASGLSMIALLFYSWVFYKFNSIGYMLLAGATMGTLIPFFYYNVFGTAERHNKIFMGDTGSLTIGTVLAFLSIKVFNLHDISMAQDYNLFILAIAPIMIPCFDVARVFVHRVRHGNNPFLPDKCHIHHKLLALGCKQWQALLTILFADAVFITINLLMSPYLNPTLILLGDLTLWILLNIMLTKMIRMREKVVGVKLYD